MAMFLPSVITGALIVRLGVYAVMTAGVAILAGSTTVAWVGDDTTHFVVALILLGVGMELPVHRRQHPDHHYLPPGPSGSRPRASTI